MRRRAEALAAMAVAALVAAVLVVGPASAGPTVLSATLAGGAEVPGPGDDDGTGTATVRLDAAAGTVCFDLAWSKIRGPWGAHIHRGAEGEAGDIVVVFFNTRDLVPIPKTITSVSGCVRNVDAAVIDAIAADPGGYYVNVHNRRFPAGAIRGQLGPGAPPSGPGY
jgi:hypothetical protein